MFFPIPIKALYYNELHDGKVFLATVDRKCGFCLQSRNTDFQDGEEVARSYVMKADKAVNMKDLHRSGDIRCRYRVHLSEYDE